MKYIISQEERKNDAGLFKMGFILVEQVWQKLAKSYFHQ